LAKQAKPRPWPVDNLRRWPISKLLPYARNPKTHPPEQVALIAQSLQQYGQTQAVLIDGDPGKTKGEIIAGHGRVLAAEQLGWPDIVVVEARGWSDKEKRAYRIADNQLTQASPWDLPLLRLEISELELAGFDIPMLGFGEHELKMISDGWGTDGQSVKDSGEHLDGIEGVIEVEVESKHVDEVREVIKRAIETSGFKAKVDGTEVEPADLARVPDAARVRRSKKQPTDQAPR